MPIMLKNFDTSYIKVGFHRLFWFDERRWLIIWLLLRELWNLDGEGRAHTVVREVDAVVEATVIADAPRAVVDVAARRTSPIKTIVEIWRIWVVISTSSSSPVCCSAISSICWVFWGWKTITGIDVISIAWQEHFVLGVVASIFVVAWIVGRGGAVVDCRGLNIRII